MSIDTLITIGSAIAPLIISIIGVYVKLNTRIVRLEEHNSSRNDTIKHMTQALERLDITLNTVAVTLGEFKIVLSFVQEEIKALKHEMDNKVDHGR